MLPSPLQAPPPLQTTLNRGIGYFPSHPPSPGLNCLFYSRPHIDLVIFLFRAFTTSPSCDEFGSDGNLLTTRGHHSGSESFLVSGAGEGEEEEEVYENQPTIMATSNGRPPSRPPPPLSRPPGVRPVQFGPSPPNSKSECKPKEGEKRHPNFKTCFKIINFQCILHISTLLLFQSLQRWKFSEGLWNF